MPTYELTYLPACYMGHKWVVFILFTDNTPYQSHYFSKRKQAREFIILDKLSR